MKPTRNITGASLKPGHAISAFIVIAAAVIAVAGALPALHAAKPDKNLSRLFFLANSAYREGDFDAAAGRYEELIDAGISNGDLYYNLGNAYLKSGELGEAIAAYKKAHLFMPRDEDLAANLRYALGRTKDKIECSEAGSIIKQLCFWYSRLNVFELTLAFLVAHAGFWTIMTIRLFLKRDILTIALYFFLLCSGTLGCSAAIKWYTTYGTCRGVVTEQQILVRAGTSTSDTVLFKLHEGTEFSWLKERDGWIEITLCDNKRGWVKKSVVERIAIGR